MKVKKEADSIEKAQVAVNKRTKEKKSE